MKHKRRVKANGPTEALPARDAFLSAEISDHPLDGLRGHLDVVSPSWGIEGWVIDCAEKEHEIEVELLAGDEIIARTRTGLAREDVSEALDARCRPGFRFMPEAFDALKELVEVDLPVRVRVSGTHHLFRLEESYATVGAIQVAFFEASLARYVRSVPLGAEASLLLDGLARQVERAMETADRPLFPLSDQRMGRIENFYAAGGGALWFSGWGRRDLAAEFPAVIIDQRRYACAAATMQYERPDLPAQFTGLIGFILTSWKPSTRSGEYFMYIGEAGGQHFAIDPSARLLNAETLLAEFERVRASVSGAATVPLRALLTSGGNWLPNNAKAAGFAAEAAVDRVILVPGFGAFVEGWAICPSKKVTAFALKIGDCILSAEATSTFFKERQDLASVFPEGAAHVGQAGFGTVLNGAITASDVGTPLLKVLYSDGTSSVHGVDPRVVRRFNAMADSDALLRLFPAIQFESFFPAFAAAVQRDTVAALQPPMPVISNPTDTAVVVVCPASKSNTRLLFENIAQHVSGLPDAPPILILATRSDFRSEVMRLVHELRDQHHLKTSLFFIDDAGAALSLLPYVLFQLRIQRFVFLEKGVVLSREGWEAAREYFRKPSRGSILLEIGDGGSSRAEGALGCSCFGWNSAEFALWSQRTPIYAPGPSLDQRLIHVGTMPPRIRGAARRLEQRKPQRLVELIDLALHRHDGGHA